MFGKKQPTESDHRRTAFSLFRCQHLVHRLWTKIWNWTQACCARTFWHKSFHRSSLPEWVTWNFAARLSATAPIHYFQRYWWGEFDWGSTLRKDRTIFASQTSEGRWWRNGNCVLYSAQSKDLKKICCRSWHACEITSQPNTSYSFWVESFD